MGILDRWIKKITSDPSALPVAAASVPVAPADPLDAEVATMRGRLTLDDRGRRYAEGHDFQLDLRTLDDGGRARAADHVLADALLVTPDAKLRRQLAERLLYRGLGAEASSLLEDLRTHPAHQVFALTALAEQSEAKGDIGRALELYESVLAVDITLGQQKARARRLRAAREAMAPKSASERSALARFLGARAAGSRYSVLDEIGRGGAATVFRARDRVADREVALKIFHPRGRAAERRARILREARIAGAFDHPHIVPILDVDSDHDLLVMHLCDGGSLRHRLQRGKLSHLDAAEIGAILLRTLSDVHDAGRVHLDVKPSNMLFHDDRPMLCDFGTAGLAELGAAAGTRAYMAPEHRAHGTAKAPADIYAAGLVVYECLVGALPPGAASGSPRMEITTLPPGPARRAIERVLTDMCALDPDDRTPKGRHAAALLLEGAALPLDDREGTALYAHIESLAAREGDAARARFLNNQTVKALRAPSTTDARER